MRRKRLRRLAHAPAALALASAALALLSGCGGSATPTAPADDQPNGVPTGAPVTQPPAAASSTPPTGVSDSGAMVRVVNVWASAEEIGPTAALRVLDDGQVLAEVAPGEISDYVAVPAGGFFDRPAALEVIAADMRPADEGRDVRDIEEGDRVTLFVEGGTDGIGETRRPAVSAFSDSSWPSVPPEKITLLAYPGPLTPLPIEEDGIALATVDNRCLVDENGDEHRLGWGGLAMYFILDSGTTEVAVSHFPHPDGCQPNDPIGTVTVSGEGGQRFALVPWGTSGNVQLLLVEMDAQP